MIDTKFQNGDIVKKFKHLPFTVLTSLKNADIM